MTIRLRARGSDGRVAVYTGTDNLPFEDPLAHLSRVKFHSSLDYPKVIDERTVNVTFPRRNNPTGSTTGINSSSGVSVATYTLFAHGRPGFPWVIASFNIGGQKVSATGSVPVQQARNISSNAAMNWGRWVTIGADATNVYAYEYTVLQRLATTNASDCLLPAITVPITVWVTDEILEGAAPPPDPLLASTTIRIKPDRVIFDRGKFDSDSRYLRTGPNIAAASTLLGGPSLELRAVVNGASTVIAWRYRCGSFVMTGPASGGEVPAANLPVNTPTPFSL
jgi:hypothetical protein